MKKRVSYQIGLGLVGCLLMGTVVAAEQYIAKPMTKNYMTIQPLYIQAVVMMKQGGMNSEMKGDMKSQNHEHSSGHHHGKARKDSDIHLEVDVQVAKNSPYGFPEGSWMPYLMLHYQLAKKGSDWTSQGMLVPMAASDGPHYGNNVKLNGAGRYQLSVHFLPPDIPYHTDKETRVDGWWKPFEEKWDFSYFGVGKKGGY